MDKEIRFGKYTTFGNTFIVADENATPLAGDRRRAEFARWALEPNFGIGGTGNVLFLRRTAGGPGEADLTFRIFEHDGDETLSCGNGLLTTTTALRRAYGGERCTVLTELPAGRPKAVRIGVDAKTGDAWARTGPARAVPAALFARTYRSSGADGSPGGRLRPPAPRRPAADRGPGRRASRLLVECIGSSINHAYRRLFPQGVHVNLARVRDPAGLLEYRTYERAIDRETLACGSGALALAYVARRREPISGDEATRWPHRCRWHRPEALGATQEESGLVLTGRPRLVCDGVVPLPWHGTTVGPSPAAGTGEPSAHRPAGALAGVRSGAARAMDTARVRRIPHQTARPGHGRRM